MGSEVSVLTFHGYFEWGLYKYCFTDETVMTRPDPHLQNSG